jgi:hypothetical protein
MGRSTSAVAATLASYRRIRSRRHPGIWYSGLDAAAVGQGLARWRVRASSRPCSAACTGLLTFNNFIGLRARVSRGSSRCRCRASVRDSRGRRQPAAVDRAVRDRWREPVRRAPGRAVNVVKAPARDACCPRGCTVAGRSRRGRATGTRVSVDRRSLGVAVAALDPRRAFGLPTIANRGLTVEVIADRFKGGDSIELLAKEYGLSRSRSRWRCGGLAWCGAARARSDRLSRRNRR